MRPGKLGERLAELEREYRAGLRREFQKVASGRSSRYLDRKVPGLFDGRYWQSAEAARLEKLEHEIETLRLKLGEASPGPLVLIVRRFEKERVGAKDRWNGAEVRIAKACLEEVMDGR